MNDLKNDRRIRKTKKALSQSLTKLMIEKPINKITITELTELADVNRSTFYLYYQDIYDMVDKIETEMMDEFQAALQKLFLHEQNTDNILSFFLFVFDYVKENADFCKVLLGKDGDYNFLNKFKKVITETHPPIVNKNDRFQSNYFMPFAISGCIGVIQQWLQEDMVVPPEDISKFVIELIANGVNSFQISDTNKGCC
jgi:AcrR family transcriptional regulator